MPKELLVLFIFFITFVFINFMTYFLIYLKMKEKLFRDLTLYWLVVLLVYLVEGIVHQGKLALSLIFIVNLVPVYIISNILMRSYELKLNLLRYIVGAVTVVLFAFINNFLGLSFFILAMPIAIVSCFPFVEGIYATFVSKKKEAHFIQKLMAGVIFTSGIACSLNYATNRLTPGTELVGFGTGFFTYITASILLPVFTIQELSREKTQRLEILVKERTEELLTSNIQKEKLLRVVIHDISNALQALGYHNGKLSSSTDPKINEVSEKIQKNINSISDITHHVREMARAKSSQVKLVEVDIQDCLNEIRELFFERYYKKNIDLQLENNVPRDICIKVERVMFVHSILSNIISNSLKFSYPGSVVILNVYESLGIVSFDILDSGVGMTDKMLTDLFEHDITFSKPGTSGESGSGLGMPLVKIYAELFGGVVHASSSTSAEFNGTRIVVSLPAFYKSLDTITNSETLLKMESADVEV